MLLLELLGESQNILYYNSVVWVVDLFSISNCFCYSTSSQSLGKRAVHAKCQLPKKIIRWSLISWDILQEWCNHLPYGFWFVSILTSALQPWKIIKYCKIQSFLRKVANALLHPSFLWIEIDSLSWSAGLIVHHFEWLFWNT